MTNFSNALSQQSSHIRCIASHTGRTLTVGSLVLCVAMARNAGAQTGNTLCAANSARATVEVQDRTGAVIVGAAVAVDGNPAGSSDGQGRLATGCLAVGDHRVSIAAGGFEPDERRIVAGGPLLTVRLRPVTVETTVEAVQDEPVSTE